MPPERTWKSLRDPLEALGLVVFGVGLALVVAGRLDPAALLILLVLGYVAYMARGMVRQARRFRPVEPPRVWWVTLLANLALMGLGIGAFGWYLLAGAGQAWVPFLIFIAGMIALRQWRQGVTARLYAWRTPALRLLQQGEYRKLVRELEADPTTPQNPDKLAMLALAYVELNKLHKAEELLTQARALAPDFASVNGAVGALRRHQARWADAVVVLQKALSFEDNVNTRYYLGLCQYLAGDHAAARATLRAVLADPTLIRQGQVFGAYILGQIAEANGDAQAARAWYARMAEHAPQVLPRLDEEARRHKQTPYGDTLKTHVRAMQRILARRPLDDLPTA